MSDNCLIPPRLYHFLKVFLYMHSEKYHFTLSTSFVGAKTGIR